jgi:hypothetical protein
VIEQHESLAAVEVDGDETASDVLSGGEHGADRRPTKYSSRVYDRA